MGFKYLRIPDCLCLIASALAVYIAENLWQAIQQA